MEHCIEINLEFKRHGCMCLYIHLFFFLVVLVSQLMCQFQLGVI